MSEADGNMGSMRDGLKVWFGSTTDTAAQPAAPTLTPWPEEVKFKIGEQWFTRGNRSPSWFAHASAPDGSMTGIVERVDAAWWFVLEAYAALKKEIERG